MRVADIPGSIPQDMLLLNNASIGDEYTGGTYLDIRCSISGKVYHWKLGPGEKNASTEIQQFRDKLRQYF